MKKEFFQSNAAAQTENAKVENDNLDLEMNEAEGRELPSVAAAAEDVAYCCCCCSCCC